MPRLKRTTVMLLSAAVPVLAGFTALAPFGNARPGHVGSCAATVDSLAEAWGSLNEWRTLAPFPVPREATPTRAIGVWIERWHLTNAAEEWRLVSAEQTTVVRIAPADCQSPAATHRRSYSATSNAFTDQKLRELLAASRRGLIYVWSPGMPLSVAGLKEAEVAAAKLGISFTALMAEARPGEPENLRVNPRYLQTLDTYELVYRNAAIHYPTALFYRDGHVIDVAIPGYKNRDTYQELSKRYLDVVTAAQLPPKPSVANTVAAEFWVDHKARLNTLSTVRTVRNLGFFFKPISGTNLISYTSNDASFLFDLVTQKEQRIPGSVDPVPTPDGRFLTRPGLLVYPIPTIVKGDTIPVYTDPELPDEYQTASVLRETRGSIRYRVLTGWHEGARFRDYDVVIDNKGAFVSMKPVGAPFVPCGDRRLTLPINAKSGREFGAFDGATGTNVILEVTEDHHCAEKLNLGFASGKLSFSYDGTAIAFSTSRINVDAEGVLLKPNETFYQDALVLYRKTGRIVSLSLNRQLHAKTFPEFTKSGAVMLLDQQGPGRPVEVIRIVEIK